MRFGQGLQRGIQGNPATAAVTLLVLFTLFQQPGVETEAGIDQKVAVIDYSQTDGLDPGVEQIVHCLFGVLGDAVGTSEVIEGPLGKHTKGHALSDHRLTDRIQRAVAAHGNHNA